jgi:ubiquinone/menaquinone biosynthesis C-methylase UbiE
VEAKVLIIDELHALLASTHRQQEILLCLQRLSTCSPIKAKAAGIDIWHETTRQILDRLRRNGEIEGVSNRIEFREADARQMPFADATFDVAFASLSRHHAGSHADRKRRALTKIKRVLKPSGVILIYDMLPITSEAARSLRELGIRDIQRIRGQRLRILLGAKTSTRYGQ